MLIACLDEGGLNQKARATTVGYPWAIRADRGTKCISRDLDLWAYARGVMLDFSQPGTPTDNALVESFNGRPREECLNTDRVLCLADARAKIEAWRPHT